MQGIDAITTNLENSQLGQRNQQNTEEDSETDDDANTGGTMDCVPTPYGCIDINDPALRP